MKIKIVIGIARSFCEQQLYPDDYTNYCIDSIQFTLPPQTKPVLAIASNRENSFNRENLSLYLLF